MLETVREAMKDELFDYLNYLIKTELYPYLFQAKGKYSAKKLHKEIENEFDLLLNGIEKGEDADIDKIGYNICWLMDKDLNEFILEKAKDNIYFLDLTIFAKDVSVKIRKIINNYKNLYEFPSMESNKIKKLAQ